MDENKLKLIEQNLTDSLQWRSKNSATMDNDRVEGLLSPGDFKNELLTHLQAFSSDLETFTQHYLCGFEIEFFLPPAKIFELKQQIAVILPDYQMLLISLDKVIKTNHRHFYLIKENTGEAPKGMHSYELVSPILDFKSLPYFIHAFFELLQNIGAADNDSIGFHLHVSTPQKTPISPLSLLYFLDQQQVLSAKERQFTRDIIQQFFDYAPQSWQWIFEEVTRKCYNVNLLHYNEHNHIELRSMGGQGYLKEQQHILQTCFHCFEAYELATHTPIKQIAQGILNNYPLTQEVIHTESMSAKQLASATSSSVWFV